MQKDDKVIFFGGMSYWYKSFSFGAGGRIENGAWVGFMFIEILVHLLTASLLAEEKEKVK
jgi:hypothetical protein